MATPCHTHVPRLIFFLLFRIPVVNKSRLDSYQLLLSKLASQSILLTLLKHFALILQNTTNFVRRQVIFHLFIHIILPLHSGLRLVESQRKPLKQVFFTKMTSISILWMYIHLISSLKLIYNSCCSCSCSSSCNCSCKLELIYQYRFLCNRVFFVCFLTMIYNHIV